MSDANIHATCVRIANAADAFGAPADAGILLLGESGSGKSDIALRLIERGAMLVADDRCELFAKDNALWGRAPRSLAGLIEVRGIGIMRIPRAAEARIALAVRIESAGNIARLPEREDFAPPQSLAIPREGWPPLVHVAGQEFSAPAKILAAAAAFAHALFREERNPE